MVEALGPVPNARTERDDWEERAGVVAAYCELRGHDDSGDALGNLEVQLVPRSRVIVPRALIPPMNTGVRTTTRWRKKDDN